MSIIKKVFRKVFNWVLLDTANVNCHKTTMFSACCQVHHSTLGRYTSIGRYSKIVHANIGDFCSISWDVTINAVAHDYKRLSTHSFTKRPDIGNFVSVDTRSYKLVQIGNDVWIGAHAVIMPGIKIADGAIVGAGSIVTKDVEPYQIVAGNPAIPIKFRFNKSTIDTLLRIKWWDFPENIIRENIGLFQSDFTDGVLLARLLDVCDV